MIKDCLCWPLCPTLLLQFCFAPPIHSDRQEQHTWFGWVIGGWGCCWIFSLISTVEGWRLIIFLKAAPSLCVANDNLAWTETWSAVGFCPDLEQSEPGLLSQASAKKLGWDWALSTHLEFLKMSAFIHYAFNFFSSPKETDSQLKIFHIIPFWKWENLLD